MIRKKLAMTAGLLVMTAGLAVNLMTKSYIAAVFIVIAGLLICVFHYFERQTIVVEKAVLIALLSALSSAGRVLFSAVPSVQPSSFIIMVSGAAFGKEIGLMTGVVTAVASNLMLGQGPWTPWQMFFWGLMGFLAGVFGAPLKKNKWLFILYGFLWGFLFGWGMNLWFLTGYGPETALRMLIAAGVASFYFDLSHAASNALLLFFAGERIIPVFERISAKYGILK